MLKALSEENQRMDRLDKLVAAFSDYSRKDVRKLVREKRVEVNGICAQSFDQKISDDDSVTLDGEPILRKRRIVAILNKPMGFVTSTEDPRDRTVMELVPKEWGKMGVYPVGRLDKDTEGLLLFTNDGALAHSIISPKSGIEKEYYVEHEGRVKEEDIEAFSNGVILDDEKLKPAKLIRIEDRKSKVIITEGKYHQVRRMMASRGLDVTYLMRIREGGLLLKNLEKGHWKELSPEEERLFLTY